MSNITAKIRDENEYVVELVKSHNAQGKAFFAYVLMQKSNLAAFRESLTEGNTKLIDYGVILASGLGHEPSEEVWKEVQAKLKRPE